eukprot:gnl/MRDRNA2_/MRDRNA2_51509_c0_seq1.p1 gnl/MRDRNA2_/MRDRNA2_51509_c0~~gnl/MRDRNA2_/MRDRNA2_51509_c0_seq1.p1  ORF type:complete len:185 (+),score=32.11 gnl/MRDRNA2_/MRDRNA2_51509_c0_seq1:131-685(+)
MSRGISAGGGVWYDGYSFHGDGIVKDVRHAHSSIHPKFRSASHDLRRSIDGFGWTSTYNSTPMNHGQGQYAAHRRRETTSPVLGRNEMANAIAVGTNVTTSAGLIGTVRWVGQVAGKSGVFAGVALEEPKGKNSGNANGQQYFTCKPMHGLFLRPSTLHKLEVDLTEEISIHRAEKGTKQTTKK